MPSPRRAPLHPLSARFRCAGRSVPSRRIPRRTIKQFGKTRSGHAFARRAAAPIVAPTYAPTAVPITPNNEPTNAPTVAPTAAPEIASPSRSFRVVMAGSPSSVEKLSRRAAYAGYGGRQRRSYSPGLLRRPHSLLFASGHKNPERPGIGSVSRCTFSRPAIRAAPPKISWVRRLS